MSARPRILLVGPMPLEGTPIGGTQVSFGGLVRRMRASERFDCEVVDTSRPVLGRSKWTRMSTDARALTATLHAIARVGPRCDAILFNASSGGTLRAGPLVWAAAQAIRTPLGMRVFGGDFDLRLARAGSWTRSVARRTFLSAPLLLLQTKHLCAHFGRHAGVRWLPTTRDTEPVLRAPSKRCTRFLLLSQLKREKGVGEALAASDRLPEGATLTLHGPSIPGVEFDDAHPRARFAGTLRREQVAEVIAAHDALVFPSWYEGEGMPGAVVEAMQAGLPVIATRWRSLPDLVEHERNGLLVPPRDAASLGDAMLRMQRDTDLFARLGQEARRTGEHYRAGPWHQKLELCLEGLVGIRSTTPNDTDLAA